MTTLHSDGSARMRVVKQSCRPCRRASGEGIDGPDMPLASDRKTASLQFALHQRPLSNTRPLHHQNSARTYRVQRVAQ